MIEKNNANSVTYFKSLENNQPISSQQQLAMLSHPHLNHEEAQVLAASPYFWKNDAGIHSNHHLTVKDATSK